MPTIVTTTAGNYRKDRLDNEAQPIGATLVRTIYIEEDGMFVIGDGTKDVDLDGITIDEDEIVGQESGVDQFSIRASDGKAVAGGGTVILDESGIRIKVVSSYQDVNSLDYIRTDTSGVIASIYSIYNTSPQGTSLNIKAWPTSGYDTSVVISAESGDATDEAGVTLDVIRNDTNSGGLTISSTSADGESAWFWGLSNLLVDCDTRVDGGLYIGADTDPDDNDIHYVGNLKSFKGSTNHDVYALKSVTPVNLYDNQGTPVQWTGGQSVNSGTYIFNADANGNDWPTDAKQVLVLIQAQFSSAGDNIAGRYQGSSTTEGIQRCQNTSVPVNEQWIIDLDTSGDFEIVLSANATNCLCRLLGYYI